MNLISSVASTKFKCVESPEAVLSSESPVTAFTFSLLKPRLTSLKLLLRFDLNMKYGDVKGKERLCSSLYSA